MWIHLLTLGLIDGAGSEVAAPAGGNFGFEMGGRRVREVHHKPIRRRILEAAKKRYREAATQSNRPEQAIEKQAAVAVLAGEPDTQFDQLMAQWRSYKAPSIKRSETELTGLFVAQVAFEVQRLQRLQQEIDDEEAVLALMLA